MNQTSSKYYKDRTYIFKYYSKTDQILKITEMPGRRSFVLHRGGIYVGTMHASLKHEWDITGETFPFEEAPGRRWLKMSEGPIILHKEVLHFSQK